MALDFNSYGGKLYVIPNDLNVFSTYWSQEPFRQAGAAPPPVDWRAGGFDHGALLDAARRLTDRNTPGAERYGILVEPVVNSTLPVPVVERRRRAQPRSAPLRAGQPAGP